MNFMDRVRFAAVKVIAAATKSVNLTADLEWYLRHGYPGIAGALGAGLSTHTGRPVSEESALTCSVVWACTRVISETVAGLPLHLMRETATGRELAKNHPLYSVLHDQPNDNMSDMEFREALTAHAVTYGNGYALIARRQSGECVGLLPVSPKQVTPDRDKSGALIYVYKDGNSQEKTYSGVSNASKVPEIFHLRGLSFDGIRGYSVIEKARQSIALAQIQEEYVSRYFAKGGRRPYLIEHPTRFKNEPEYQEFRNRWEKDYGNADSFHSVPIVEGGLKYTELGFTLQEAQFLEGRQFSVPEICRWFRISPHLVGDLSRATFSNIEHLAIEFVQQTLMAWLLRWEKAIKRCCLTPAERSGMYAKHNVSALLRGDFQSRTQGYATAVQNGWLSRDEVRALEDMDAIEADAGKSFTIQLNMQTLPGTGAALASESRDKQPQGGDDGNQKNQSTV